MMIEQPKPVQKKVQPKPLKKVKCVKCGELLIKFFPFCGISDSEVERMQKHLICTRCDAKLIFIREMDRYGMRML